MVLGEVKKRYASTDSAGFCIKSDGTRGRCNVDAEYMCTEILRHVSDAGYSAENIVSECYDSASVLSGVRGDVSALLKKKLSRHIIYIHCHNHQLHLVVVHAMQEEPCAKRFFDLSDSLYNFFCHHYVSEKYDAPCLR